MQRVINAKAKIGLKSNVMIWNTNIYYFKSYYLFYNTFSKTQTQDSKNKDFSYSKKSKTKGLKSILSCDNAMKSTKKKKRRIKRKSFKSISRIIPRNEKNQSWLLVITLLTSQKKDVILVRLCDFIAKKKPLC